MELTERDLRILETLRAHRVLTTPQVGELFFYGRSARVAQRRLLILAVDDLVHRFLPPGAGRHVPNHWALGAEGASVLAPRLGVPVDEVGYRATAQRHLRLSSQLGHAVGLSQTYVSFVTSARKTPGAKIQRWWPESECRVNWGRHVRPDGYLRWSHGDKVLDVFVEYDTGSETLSRVTGKVSRYRSLAEETGICSPVLFVVPGPGRADNLCRMLGAGSTWVPVYVTTLEQLMDPGPTRPIWRKAGDRTHTLHELAEIG